VNTERIPQEFWQSAKPQRKLIILGWKSLRSEMKTNLALGQIMTRFADTMYAVNLLSLET
jgi:hypothetical protein